MKKMFYITNIPTPYRNYRFNKMAEQCLEAGIKLEVLYMNAHEPDRNWGLETEFMQHDYKIFSHRTVTKKLGMWMHFSPALQYYLLKQDYDIAVLGGLASPAHFITSLLLRSNRINVLSVESNLASIGNAGSLATKVKRFLMRRFSYFQVTGQRSIKFIQHYVPKLELNNVITLPNVINEGLFASVTPKVIAESTHNLLKNQRAAGNKIILIPARLIEEKGLFPFLKVIKEEDKICVLIAGDGHLKAELERFIVEGKINVHLLGALPPEQIVGLMKTVDFLALPSKSDPSPLSVIEASACGLPMIISRNVGNFEDVLVEGGNGWGFEFNNLQDTRQALQNAMAVDVHQYQKMREKSRAIFEQTFATEKVLKQYMHELNKLVSSQLRG